MKLTLAERFTALDAIPHNGDYITLKHVRDLREKLAPSEHEIKDLGIKADGPNISWDTTKDEPKEIEITEFQLDIIRNGLKALDAKKKLTENHLSIYERLVINQQTGQSK